GSAVMVRFRPRSLTRRASEGSSVLPIASAIPRWRVGLVWHPIQFVKVNQSRSAIMGAMTEELGNDSLEAVELLMELEGQFGLHIPERDLAEIETAQDLLRYL